MALNTPLWETQRWRVRIQAERMFMSKLITCDGDGTTDFAVWRPSSGLWYIAPSFALNPAQEFAVTALGVSGDVPVPGDYDGDGRSDIAIFRSGIWYVIGSGTGSLQFPVSEPPATNPSKTPTFRSRVRRPVSQSASLCATSSPPA